MRLSNVELVGLNAELGITRLTLHDEHLFGHGTHSMTNLTGSEAPHLVQTKVSAAEILRGEVRDPSGGEGTTAFSHSVTLQVAEKGQLETVDLGYATLALRDEAEEAVGRRAMAREVRSSRTTARSHTHEVELVVVETAKKVLRELSSHRTRE